MVGWGVVGMKVGDADSGRTGVAASVFSRTRTARRKAARTIMAVEARRGRLVDEEDCFGRLSLSSEVTGEGSLGPRLGRLPPSSATVDLHSTT